jgi:GrpB-like predicted nucleotidyltransferase (UPF0157 family)
VSAEPEAGREFRGGTILGEERGESVEVVSYDPAWPVHYEQMRARLALVLGPTAARIEHVGSTAVPGLAAKPVVDIQVSVGDLDAEAAYRPAIESLGFGLRYRKEYWRYFRPVPGVPRDFQVHVCQSGSKWERDHLLFRDYMRTHPDRAAEYGALKRALAPKFGLDRVGYTDAKVPFIDAALRDAGEWAAEVGWRP